MSTSAERDSRLVGVYRELDGAEKDHAVQVGELGNHRLEFILEDFKGIRFGRDSEGVVADEPDARLLVVDRFENQLVHRSKVLPKP